MLVCPIVEVVIKSPFLKDQELLVFFPYTCFGDRINKFMISTTMVWSRFEKRSWCRILEGREWLIQEKA
jgi:hypothetical protein